MKQKLNFVTIIIMTLLFIVGAICLISHKNDLKLTVVSHPKQLPPSIRDWADQLSEVKDIRLLYEPQAKDEYRYWLLLRQGSMTSAKPYDTFKISAVVDGDLLKIYIEDALTRKDFVPPKTLVAYCIYTFPPDKVKVYYNKELLKISMETFKA